MSAHEAIAGVSKREVEEMWRIVEKYRDSQYVVELAGQIERALEGAPYAIASGPGCDELRNKQLQLVLLGSRRIMVADVGVPGVLVVFKVRADGSIPPVVENLTRYGGVIAISQGDDGNPVAEIVAPGPGGASLN